MYDILTSFLSTMLRYLSKFASFIPAAPERAVLNNLGSSKQISRKTSSASLDVSECILRLPAKNTAVVFIEYQNEFATPGGKLHDVVKECMQANNVIENSREFAKKAREEGAQVVHVPIIFEEGHNEIAKNPFGILKGIKEDEVFKAGTWGSKFCEGMRPKENDVVIKGKIGLCAFSSTNLDFVLRQNGIKNIILGGYLTNCCIESTMRNAYEFGYKVYTMKDCCAATSLEAHKAAVNFTFPMFSIPTNSTDIAFEKK